MKTLNPNDFAMGFPASLLRWAQSIYNSINGQIDFGVPNGKDSSGNYNFWDNPNCSGVLVRVSPFGNTDNKYIWVATNTAIPINHGLVDQNRKPRQPIGVILVNSNKDLRIYQPTTPDTTNVYVAPTDNTSYATLYIF